MMKFYILVGGDEGVLSMGGCGGGRNGGDN